MSQNNAQPVPARTHGFQPGQSGNPGGRPKQRHIRELARERTPECVAALVRMLSSDTQAVGAATILLAYGYGRPIQTHAVRVIRSIEDLSDEELRAIIGEPAEGDAPEMNGDGTPLIEHEAPPESGKGDSTP